MKESELLGTLAHAIAPRFPANHSGNQGEIPGSRS